MNSEFNLEKALAGKAVVHKTEGWKATKIIDFGEYICVKFDDYIKPVLYAKELINDYLIMAEEEMYVALSDEEIESCRLNTCIQNSPSVFRKQFRVFKLVEVHGKD
jgi:hypothetical protein